MVRLGVQQPTMSDGSIGTPAESQHSGAKFSTDHSLSPLQTLGRWIRHSISHKQDGGLKRALEDVLDEHEDDVSRISDEERILLRNMIAFGELKVSDVMIPRTDICAVPITTSFDDMRDYIIKQMHTRIPVYEGTLDNIIGFLHLKDFFRCISGQCAFDISALKRDVLFVPPSMKIVDLLLKMRLSSCHIAIVVDEYGGTDGLVTMEDLFEEIVGEIQDEHDDTEEQPTMVWQSERVLIADARVAIEDLSEELQVDMYQGQEEDDYDTLGGLIFSYLGRIPAKGEVIDYSSGVKLEILSADPRSIKKVRLVKPLPVASAAEA